MSLCGDPLNTPDLVSQQKPRSRERHRLLGLQPPPVHREKEEEEEELLKVLWPCVNMFLLLFCVPGSPVSTLYLNYLSFL